MVAIQLIFKLIIMSITSYVTLSLLISLAPEKCPWWYQSTEVESTKLASSRNLVGASFKGRKN